VVLGALGAALVAGALVLGRWRRSVAIAAGGDEQIGALIARGDYERAADLHMERGDPRAALPLYQRAEARGKLARCHLALRQPAEAAQVYMQLGRHAEAAHYFQSAGRWSEAADCLVVLGSEREAAELYERSGDLRRAAELLRGLGDHENAARLFGRSGQHAEAATALLAARGRTPKALVSAAELYVRAGDATRAAGCFLDAGQARRAAELFEQLEDFQRAAECFAREQVWDRAGRCYERAGALREARACFERSGDRLHAAELAQELGELYAAGRAFYELGAYDRALEALQGVAPTSAEGRNAGRLLARIFVEKGLLDRAREQLEAQAERSGWSKEDLPELLLLAGALERTGTGLGALQVLEQIQEIEPDHADVAERIARIQERAWSSSQSLAPVDPGRYELRDEIGRGGMGVVHLAWDRELQRLVAIKFLPTDLASNSNAVQMFKREARAAAAMNHPNIVHVYDVALVSSRPCIVMEYVQGRTVRDVMRVRGRREKAPLPPRRVAEIARDICHALTYAHSQNIIHRDIKPSNILIASDGRVKLMDFGISKVVEADTDGPTQAKGTPQYMPPEQIRGREIDGRTDLYALGITMFEMATGQRPFSGEDVVDQQLHTPIPDPRTLRPDLPEELVEIIVRVCRKKPAERYASAHEMAEALGAFLAGYQDTLASQGAREEPEPRDGDR
jgi:tetratricopeptide (TPR) repeat protein